MSALDFLTGRRASDLAPVYDALALPPDRQYGIDPGPSNDRGYAFNQWLPFTTNRVGSASWVTNGADPQWGLPQTAREAMKGYVDLANATQTGSLTPEALASVTLGSMGAGMAAAPRGVLASGGSGFVPRLDPAAMERARRMGFNVDRPQFHGTPAPDFPAFGTVSPWEAIRNGKPPGIWTAENPAVANRFSEAEARSRLGLSPTSQSPELLQDQAHSRVLPLFARSERTADLTLGPRPDWGDVWNTVAGHFYDGHDAVRLQNYRMFPELGPQAIWTFRDPSQLRSWFARFDPGKRGSSDLMAGSAVPGPAPVPGLRVTPQADAPGLANFRRMMDDEKVY